MLCVECCNREKDREREKDRKREMKINESSIHAIPNTKRTNSIHSSTFQCKSYSHLYEA